MSNQLSVFELLKSLKLSTLAPVYLLLGPETYFKQEVKQAFKNLIPPEEQEFNISQYDLNVTPIQEVLAEAAAMPFFGERRVILLENPSFLTGKGTSKVEHDVKALMAYLNNPQPTTTLVFLAEYEKLDERKKLTKMLKQGSVVINNQKINEAQLRSLIKQKIRQAGYQIDAQALDHFIARTNADLQLAMSELPKLELVALTDKIITTQLVDKLVAKSLEHDVFLLVDYVLQHQVGKSLMLYHELLQQKEPPLRINALLISQFRLLLQTKILLAAGYNQKTMPSLLKVHPFRVKLALQKVRQLSLPKLEAAFKQLVKIEQQLKTTQQKPETLFQLFVASY